MGGEEEIGGDEERRNKEERRTEDVATRWREGTMKR